MKLKLSCSDFTFPLLRHDQALDLISMLGFEGVDIGLFAANAHLKPVQALKNPRASAKELSAKVHGRGLKFADIFLTPGPDFQTLAANHPDARIRRESREIFLRALEFVVRCQAKHLGALPGVHWPGESYADSLRRCSEELAWRADQSKRAGVEFSVEPHLGSIISTPEKTLRLLEMTPGLTLTLDYGHFTFQGFPDREIEPLVARASHFHARGGARSRLQTSVKNNRIDFKRVLHAMKRTGYRGYVAVEYVWIDWNHCNEVDNISETILMRDFLRKVKS